MRMLSSLFSLSSRLLRRNASKKLQLYALETRRASSLATDRADAAQLDYLRYEEPLAGYCPGGYDPMKIGDTLNERYRIHRKLGWGRYSTVWLVHDKQTNEYRSMKILTDFASNTSALHELEYLQHVAKYDSSHPGYSRIIRLFDHFYHSGPYGSHLCLVTDVLGESVASLASYMDNNLVHPTVVKSIVRQVLLGLAYLHKSGIIHTDLKLDNFLVEIEGMNAYVNRALESSSPKVYRDVRAADGRLINYVTSTPLAIPDEDIENFKPVNVKIADLGVACWASKTAEHFTDQIQPPALRAPEVWVGAGWDAKCDIWSLGLLVLEMLRGMPLVPAQSTTLSSKVFWLFCYFGKFPEDLLEKGKYNSKYFKPDGSFIYDFPEEASQIPRWPAFIKGLDKILHPDEFNNLMSFLESALKLRPEDRPTAEQLLKHEWINTETRFLER